MRLSRGREREDWWGWRGGMTAQVEANTQKLDDMTTELRQTLGRYELNFNRRMDKQDEAIDKILVQARLTNGRVTDLESEHKVEVQVRTDQGRRTMARLDSRRYRVTVLVGLSGACGTLIGVLAQHILN